MLYRWISGEVRTAQGNKETYEVLLWWTCTVSSFRS